ncbi:MlaD family protein [Chitiniphilus purpureus]|uniref:MlaD family protein n=1 Tax=Chitiniphilus purpureus TaxID=2981137 RepID=A0ABY6DIZ9_9NEIS|nr:MlaD family protein [Chitiniphilus sp. CD1]UXY14320.1 MlaD family protein [Chitiniphilus sp. CD1]
MKLLRDNDPRFQWLSWRVGAFVGSAAMLLIMLVVLLGLKQGYFVPKSRLHFVAENGKGMLPGMQVRLSGFKIGVVDSVALNEQAKVDVELLVEERYLKWIKPDSSALMQQEGLIGDHYIEIVGGSPNAPPVEDGAKLTFAPTMGLSEIALDLRGHVLPVIDSVQGTLDYLNDPQGDLRATAANVRRLSTELHETRAAVDKLLANLDRLTGEQVPQVLASTDAALRRTERIAGELEQRLPGMLDRLDGTLGAAQGAASEARSAAGTLRRAVDEAAPRLPSLIRNTDDLVIGGRQVLDGASRAWPLRLWVSPPDASAPLAASRE